MTAADKLRELLASRPALPNTEELVRWWRTSGELVAQLLDERRDIRQAADYAENLVGSFAPEWFTLPDRIRAVAQGARRAIRAADATVDVLQQEARELEQQRDHLRVELDRIRPPAELFEEGVWRPCTGCHESDEGHPTGPYSETLRCNVGGGCHECGGVGATWEPAQAESLDAIRCSPGLYCVHEVKCPGAA